MPQIAEILQALEDMPEDQKAELEAEADKVVGSQKWIPNPGPQTEAFYSEADELFFGGSAGGGKSALIVGLSQTSHERSLILRRFREDAKELAETELIDKSLGGNRDGWNGADLIYRGKGHTTTFGGCQSEPDKQRYKGKPHDLKCVAKGTLVLMANGECLPIEALKIGQLVQTLEGAKKIEKLYPKQLKECVKVSAFNSLGDKIAEQVQSTSHRLLAFSEGDPSAFYVPIQRHAIGNTSASSEQKFSIFSQPLSSQTYRLVHKALFFPKFQGRRQSLGKYASCQRSTQGSDCAKYCGRNEGVQQPLLSFFHRALFLPFQRLAAIFAFRPLFLRDGFCGRALSLSLSLTDRCSNEPHQYGVRTPQQKNPLTEPKGDQQYPLLLVDVAQPSPNCLPSDAQEQIHKYNLGNEAWYAHPYTKDKRLVDRSCKLRTAAYSVSKMGVKEVYDLQIEEVRHYITDGGIVNQNCFDEVSDFLESQYEFIIAWNRTTTKGQRCRVVCTGNPPTTAEGLWVVRRWAAWLDPSYHNPAKSGEIRWYTRDEEGKEIEVDGKGPHTVGESKVLAKSRTFIRAELSDNPDLHLDGQYEAMLSQLPKELRDAYRDGKFDVALKDGAFQTIPTNWIRAAQARWTEQPPEGVPMCAIGVDVAQGGSDETVLAPRHDGWFAPLIAVPGKLTPDGKTVAGIVVANRRDNAKVIIDMGGGYGGAAYEHMKDNNIEIKGYKGAEGYNGRTSDRQLKLYNTRSAAYWNFREALDPSQPGGSVIMLPDDPELVADLTAPTYAVTRQGIQVEPKKDVVKRLGRSPDRGDAVVMSWFDGLKGANLQGGFKSYTNRKPQVIMSKRSRRKQ